MVRTLVCFTACLLGLTFAFASETTAQTSDDLRRLAASYLEAHEKQLKPDDPDPARYEQLYYLCPAALAAGETDKAKTYAQALLEMAPSLQMQPGFGPGMNGAAIHIANIVLGHIALNEGKVSEAKQFLLAAGSIKAGDPPLVSFGPDMSLAKRLIEKGEQQTVLDYLNLCAKFWTYDRGHKTTGWMAAIKAGQMPDFQANLKYISQGWVYAR